MNVLLEILPDLAALAPECVLVAAGCLLVALAWASKFGAWAIPVAMLGYVGLAVTALTVAGYAWIDAEFTLRPENPIAAAFVALASACAMVCTATCFCVRERSWQRVASALVAIAVLLAAWMIVGRSLSFDAGVVLRVLVVAEDAESSLFRVDAFATAGRILLLACLLLALLAPDRAREAAAREAAERPPFAGAFPLRRAAIVVFVHAGACTAVLTENMLIAYAGLELASLACLFGLDQGGPGVAPVPRLRSLALGLPASMILLAGIAGLAWTSGVEAAPTSLSFDAVGLALEELPFEGSRAWIGTLSWSLLVLGLAAKAGLPPFHRSFLARFAASSGGVRIAMMLSLRIAVVCILLRLLMALSGAWEWTPAISWMLIVLAVMSAFGGFVSASRARDVDAFVPRILLGAFGLALFGAASFYLFERDPEGGEIVSSYASDEAVQGVLLMLVSIVLLTPVLDSLSGAASPGIDERSRRSRLVGAALLFGFLPGSITFVAVFQLQRAAMLPPDEPELAALLWGVQLVALIAWIAFVLRARGDRCARGSEAHDPLRASLRDIVMWGYALMAIAFGLLPGMLYGFTRAAALGLRL